ncbi:MAG TPA: DNA polymerase Y family protein, partial [bacterium]|nr:DNA polymerase Y family protein [bacterium]
MIANDLFGPSAPSVACVDVPAFPLQLVLREHPEWKEDPVVIVEEDRPTAAILWANRPAREARIRRGMKFAQARSLVARLHGEVVPGDVVADAGADLLEDLLGLTPNVEPDAGAPGLFWLDPCGLAPLYGSLETWASRVHARLEERSLVSSVVVGWQRGTVFAVARTRTGATVLPDPDAESRRAARVPLARIGLSPDLLRSMAVLGVHTIGEFAALPASGLELRYGEEAARWHAVVSGCAWTPFRACRPEAPPRAEIPLDPPDHDHTRLLFGIKTALHPLLDGLAERDRGVTALQLTLELDHAPTHQERIETASPTRHVTRLVDLVRLRLAHLELPAAVERIVLVLESRELSTRQTDWARPEPRRDPRDLA